VFLSISGSVAENELGLMMFHITRASPPRYTFDTSLMSLFYSTYFSMFSSYNIKKDKVSILELTMIPFLVTF
jgi:hypothetical protein